MVFIVSKKSQKNGKSSPYAAMWFYCFGLIAILVIIFSGMLHMAVAGNSVCGDGVCSKNETKAGCKADCDEVTCRSLYQDVKNGCFTNGWKEEILDVDGVDREILWKAPEKDWVNGAIIVMHGGEGAHSSFCFPIPKGLRPKLSEILRGVPVARFGELAVKEGFAVFSLNSSFNRGFDVSGKSIGKRWFSFSQNGDEKFDLDFIEQVIDDVIPALRPKNSSKKIFMTGISNGAFMTILAATHFNEKIKAFAPVAGGDPYGMYLDMSKKMLLKRKCGPGTMRDLETHKEVHHRNACLSDDYPNELYWPVTKRNIKFKQFSHMFDGGVHYSCVEKARQQLIAHGYIDAGMFVLKDGYRRRNLEAHFWHEEYNQPMLDFFKNQSMN